LEGNIVPFVVLPTLVVEFPSGGFLFAIVYWNRHCSSWKAIECVFPSLNPGQNVYYDQFPGLSTLGKKGSPLAVFGGFGLKFGGAVVIDISLLKPF
jgi:hypothetical protein